MSNIEKYAIILKISLKFILILVMEGFFVFFTLQKVFDILSKLF